MMMIIIISFIIWNLLDYFIIFGYYLKKSLHNIKPIYLKKIPLNYLTFLIVITLYLFTYSGFFYFKYLNLNQFYFFFIVSFLKFYLLFALINDVLKKQI